MNFKSKLIVSVAALGLAFAGLSTPTYAATMYSYTGPDFTTFGGAAFYSTADFVSGYIIVASPLVNLTNVDVTPLSFSFTDGVQTLNTPNNFTSFQFDTDAAGDITQWTVQVSTLSGVGGVSTHSAGIQPPPTDNIDFGGVTINNVVGFGDVLAVGSWTSATVPTPTPEPGTFVLFFSGMLGLGMFAGKKRNRETRPATEA